MSILQLLKEATRLINKVELTNDNKNRLKDILCYLSEWRNNHPTEFVQYPQLEFILYNASRKLRTFGYNRLNKFDNSIINADNNLIAIKTVAIRYYNQLIDSIGTPLWRYLPIKVLDGYDIRLSSDEIECLKKICETFQNIADRKYITSAPFCSPQILDDNMGCVPLLDD